MRSRRRIASLVNVHWSGVGDRDLFTWSLATMLPGLRQATGRRGLLASRRGSGAVVFAPASLLAHELAHAVVARRAGVSVEA